MSNILYSQSFHEEVQTVFNFTPSELSKEEQQKIFPKLDKFFNKVISNKTEYLQPLRDELLRNDNNPYFYFDGGILLMEISNEPSDLQLVADVLVKTNLKDLVPKLYLQRLLELSIKGVNVIDAGLHIYSDPTFQVFIVEHSLLLNQGECLKFILPRYESELYVNKLIDLYSETDSVSTKESIITLLYYSRSCKADSFIKSTLKNNNSKEIKILIKNILKLEPKKRKSEKIKYQKIRRKINNVLNRINDEAIYELNQLTKELSLNYKCVN
tara:strand:+ start:58 stop:867 length:810 start_codon:yes stop_codon:yes gene_type:complete